MANKNDLLKVLESKHSQKRRDISNTDSKIKEGISKVKDKIRKDVIKHVFKSGKIRISLKEDMYSNHRFEIDFDDIPQIVELNKKLNEENSLKRELQKKLDDKVKQIRNDILLYGVDENLIKLIAELDK